jgi:hypothetical protein
VLGKKFTSAHNYLGRKNILGEVEMVYTKKLFPNILVSNVELWILLLMILIGKCKWI